MDPHRDSARYLFGNPVRVSGGDNAPVLKLLMGADHYGNEEHCLAPPGVFKQLGFSDEDIERNVDGIDLRFEMLLGEVEKVKLPSDSAAGDATWRGVPGRNIFFGSTFFWDGCGEIWKCSNKTFGPDSINIHDFILKN